MSAMAFKEFLEAVPPGRGVTVEEAVTDLKPGKALNLPAIELHCKAPLCRASRVFRPAEMVQLYDKAPYRVFAHYTCSNCRIEHKLYALDVRLDFERGTMKVCYVIEKFGEQPAFGAPVPPRALKLVGPDRDLFLQGRRCENQGLGLGAFTYYRRVIERQRDRIFDELTKVLQKISPDDPVLEELRAAKQERQFTKSVERIRHALPGALLINGHNPLTLLHGALSEGVHSLSDEECLAMAAAVRSVLFELSERLAAALSEQDEVLRAIALLSSKRADSAKAQREAASPDASPVSPETSPSASLDESSY